MVFVGSEGRHNCPTRNAGALAQSRLSSPLALEIKLAGRAPANRDRIARDDPADEHGEPALGCATHPWRTAQSLGLASLNPPSRSTWSATWTSEPGMADLSAKPRPRHCRPGSV